MKIAIIQRYKIDEDGDGIFYTTKDNVKMFENKNIKLVFVSNTENIDEVVKECNGLYVPGGVDVCPKHYHEEVSGTLKHYDFLDEIDFAYIKAFYKANKPILGVCRGQQVINVCFGGTLYQDISNHVDVWHDVKVEDISFIKDIYKKDVINVNSYHHQAVKKIADGFKVVAKSLDGTIEAMQYKNIYTVQWHPEKYDADVFINYFINNIFCKTE
ncbi:MAG: gamma-glutamyl-gamma-aminobutyrate hydrolase family protein [Erysipelotrichaceae bacterium]|nr:gamma-glutamyl-gamma-aminobutyrate hydrolase family protein [Erysipelotrichaceae bacterium]